MAGSVSCWWGFQATPPSLPSNPHPSLPSPHTPSHVNVVGTTDMSTVMARERERVKRARRDWQSYRAMILVKLLHCKDNSKLWWKTASHWLNSRRYSYQHFIFIHHCHIYCKIILFLLWLFYFLSRDTFGIGLVAANHQGNLLYIPLQMSETYFYLKVYWTPDRRRWLSCSGEWR